MSDRDLYISYLNNNEEYYFSDDDIIRALEMFDNCLEERETLEGAKQVANEYFGEAYLF